MERKTFPAQVTETDGDQGIVDAVFAVFGNIDDGNDIVHPGAFAKTFSERGRSVKVLDQHRTDSIERVLGMPMELREIGREELPVELQMKYPEAKGGALARVQFLMEAQAGKEAFVRLKAGAIDEWSFGYDVLDADFSKAQRDGKEITVRNLRTLKLYEISPVLWGMNQATTTASAKEGGPEEGKPWRVVPQGEQFCVFKLDADGEPDGEPLKCYDSASEARDYVAALYANTEDEEMEKAAVTRSESDGNHPASHYLIVEDPQKPSTWHLRVRDANGDPDHRLMGAAWAALHGGYRGNRYEGPGKQEAIRKLTRLYESEDMDMPGKDWKPEAEEKVGRVLAQRNASRLAAAFQTIAEVFEDAGIDIPGWGRLIQEEEEDEDEGKGQQAGPPAAETPTPDEGVGPSAQAPTEAEKMLAIIELRKRELELSEV